MTSNAGSFIQPPITQQSLSRFTMKKDRLPKKGHITTGPTEVKRTIRAHCEQTNAPKFHDSGEMEQCLESTNLQNSLKMKRIT